MISAIWDIETSDLKPAFGVMLCAGIKEIGKPAKILKEGRRGGNDRDLVVALRDELEKYDILIGFYSLGFDLRFLNARLRKHKERPLAKRLHVDVYRIVKKGWPRETSCSLAAVCEWLGIQGKTRIHPDQWRLASFEGDKKALKYISDHCVADVEILEKVLNEFKRDIVSVSLA